MNNLFSPLIRRWPTVVQFAHDVGAPERSVREWIRNDSIPASWFQAVVRAASARGEEAISLELLANLAESRRSRKEAAGRAAA
jgi:hypothetical protein